MKKSIQYLIIRCLFCLAILSVYSCEYLHEDQELTPDGEMGVDPTQVNVSAEVVLDLELGSFEISTANTRASEEEVGYRRRFTVDAYENGKLATRQVIYDDKSTESDGKITIPISLKLHARNYTLAVWVDYVEKQSEKDFFYNTADLNRIVCTEPYRGNSDYRDVFYGSTELDLTGYRNQWNAKVPIDIKMTRPLARYELIATDVKKFLENIKDYKEKYTITVHYGYYLPVGFNALTGETGHSLMYMQYAKSMVIPNDGSEECLIGFDYVFTNGAESFVSLNVEVANSKGTIVARAPGVKVPYKQGHLTTARGAFLTFNPDAGVGIDPDFNGDIDVNLDNLIK